MSEKLRTCIDARQAALQPVLEHLARHYADPVNLTQLARLAGLSVSRFAALFRESMGVAPYQYLCRLRVQRAQALLQAGMCGTEVAIEVGFFDQSHLARHFKRVCRMTPGEFQRSARGALEAVDMANKAAYAY